MEFNRESEEAYKERIKATPERINECVGMVIEILRTRWGVENLSNLELSQIRQDARTIAEENEKLVSRYDEGSTDQEIEAIGFNIMREPEGEVLARFLKFYGIDYFDKARFKDEKEFERVKRLLNLARESAHKPYLA